MGSHADKWKKKHARENEMHGADTVKEATRLRVQRLRARKKAERSGSSSHDLSHCESPSQHSVNSGDVFQRSGMIGHSSNDSSHCGSPSQQSVNSGDVPQRSDMRGHSAPNASNCGSSSQQSANSGNVSQRLGMKGHSGPDASDCGSYSPNSGKSSFWGSLIHEKINKYQREIESRGVVNVREEARLRMQKVRACKKAVDTESSCENSLRRRNFNRDASNMASCSENADNTRHSSSSSKNFVGSGHFSQHSASRVSCSQRWMKEGCSSTLPQKTIFVPYSVGSGCSPKSFCPLKEMTNTVIQTSSHHQLHIHTSLEASTSNYEISPPTSLPDALKSMSFSPDVLIPPDLSQLCSELGSVGSAAAQCPGTVVANIAIPTLPAYQLPNYISPQASPSICFHGSLNNVASPTFPPNKSFSVSPAVLTRGNILRSATVLQPPSAATTIFHLPSVNPPTVAKKGKRKNADFEGREEVPKRRSLRIELKTPTIYVNPKISTKKNRKGRLFFKLFAAACPPLYIGMNNTVNNAAVIGDNRFYVAADPDSLIYLEQHNLGNFFENQCKHCRAYYYAGEVNSTGVYSNCCLQGKIHIDRRKKYPPELWNLISLDSENRRKCPWVANFRENIRQYNSMFAFASFGFQKEDVPGTGPYVFKIHGAVHHRIGSLHPEGSDRKYAQLYMIDSEEANRQRLGLKSNENTLLKIVTEVDSLLRKINPFAKAFMMMREVEKKAEKEAQRTGRPPVELNMYIASDKDLTPEQYKEKKLYSLPAANEVALIFSSEDGVPPQFNHIAVHSKCGPLKHLSPYDPRIDALTYPILFPYGELGWKKDIPYVKTTGKQVPPKARKGVVVDTLTAAVCVNESIAHGDGEDANLEVGEDNRNIVEGVFDLGEVVAGVAGEIVREEDAEDESGIKHRKFVTSFEYYKFEIHIRPFDALYWLAKLKCQFFVGTYGRIEADRLYWFRKNQNLLRIDLYKNVHKFLARSAHEQNVRRGEAYVVPSTFIGGPRYMEQSFMDAMAIVTETSKPDYFITMTCNPRWKEILSACKGVLEPWEVPDVVCRVFHKKVLYLIDLLEKDGIFGNVAGYTGTIEFQKRGLPHLHLLLIMKEGHKPKTAQDVDRFIAAMLPDQKVDPVLYDIVTNCMVHSPCISSGSKAPKKGCHDEEGKCTKKFPKPFTDETIVHEDGYPEYRRAENMGICEAKTKGGASKPIDNSWVIPYNPFLLKIFGCHINVEICTTIHAVKYIYKYIYKGMDRVCLHIYEVKKDGSKVRVMDYDEIKRWVDGRYLSAVEAAWRLFGFPIQFKSHSVERLCIHVEDGQAVIFEAGKEGEALKKSEENFTKLTAFFKLCQDDESASNLLYKDVPKTYYFTRVKDTTIGADGNIIVKKTEDGKIKWINKWVKRKRINGKPCIGRITFNGNGEQELSCLRVLLLHKRGPTGYPDLKTVDGVVYETFYEAAVKLGLVKTDEHFRTIMSEAVVWAMPEPLRQLFVDMVIFNRVSDARSVYESFKNDLSEDFVREGLDRERANIKVLVDMQKMLVVHGKSLDDIGLEMPPDEAFERNVPNSVSLAFVREVKAKCEKLNPQQNLAVQIILLAVERFEFSRSGIRRDFSQFIHISPHVRSQYRSNLIHLDGPAGSGKTFVYNTVIGILKCTGLTHTCVAPTGLAASLLEGGRTIHSTFKIGIKSNIESSAKIKGQDDEAKVLKSSSVLIWDEISMSAGHLLNVVSKFYQDLHCKPFDNIMFPCGLFPVVCGGDFRQQPPVTKNVSRNACRALSVKGSFLWNSFQTIRLETNMRAAESGAGFSDWLVSVGDGIEGGMVGIDDDTVVHCSQEKPDALIDKIFGADISNMTSEDLAGRAILCPKNVDADEINNRVLARLAGKEIISYSSDCALNATTDEILEYPEEFLNTLQISGLPPHELRLKENCVIMLLRNMYASRGLCNGTRLVVRHMKQNTLFCTILTGSHAGEPAFIPKLSLEPTDTDYNFKFRRYQFPVKLSYCMTIHKSQGQSFNHVGISLKSEVFTHGQLYTALSRVTNKKHLKIAPWENFEKVDDRVRIKNVVFPQMLN